MSNKLFKSIILTTLLLFLLPVSSALAANTVQVTLPTFDVTLNGQTTGNEYSKYPLIVYKDITYFPMTYYDCRLLGLKTTWTAEDGLGISKNEDYFYEYARDTVDEKNSKRQKAYVANYPINVNGTTIDNRKEEYPLLGFRGVTYFPLTWRFAVDEFGWQYSFDHKNGLVLNNSDTKLKNPTLWTNINTYASGMSVQAPFTISGLSDNTVYSKSNDNIVHQTVGFRNVTGNDLYIENFPAIKYSVYKKIGGQNELVYWHISPTYQGDVNSFCNVDYEWSCKYLKGTVPGKYVLELSTEPYCTYQDPDSKKMVQGKIYYWHDLSKIEITLTT